METERKRNFKEIFWELLLEHTDGSQMKFASETGIPVTTVNGWLRGNRLPRLEQLLVIGDYFDVSLDYLTGRESSPFPSSYPDMPKTSPKQNKLKRRIDKLNDKELRLAEDFFDLLESTRR